MFYRQQKILMWRHGNVYPPGRRAKRARKVMSLFLEK